MADLIDSNELARRLKVPLSFVYDRTRKNGPDHIPHFKLGKYVRFDPDQIAEWRGPLRRRQSGRGFFS